MRKQSSIQGRGLVESGQRIPATKYEYLSGSKASGLVWSYAAVQGVRSRKGIEGNHLIPDAFFRLGPSETRHMARYVPALTLEKREHRGALTSYHHLPETDQPDGSRTGGLNAYLLGKGLSLRLHSYTATQVDSAIDACESYHREIGLEHAADAIREFKNTIYANPVYRKKE
jgi:hypothetical protein